MVRDKFSELIIAICSLNDDFCGATKLNKLLFFSDMEAYLELGKTITGQEYQKLPHGPAPKHVLPTTNKLERSGDLVIQTRCFGNHVQKKPIATRQPDLTVFTDMEINIINRVIDRFRNKTAKEISDISHEYVGWQLSNYYEKIPFETAFISNRPLTPSEENYAMCLTNLPEYRQVHA